MILLLVACAPKTPEAAAPAAPVEATAPAPAPEVAANAGLESRSGSTTTGNVRFVKRTDGVHVRIELAGATPGDHAVHIHENGDCSAPDATSAGSHFNPENTAHGDHASPEHHAGDFGNVTVGADGSGSKELVTSSIGLGEGVSVVGLSVIVHEKPDDFSQPTGNAGARQACGLIALK